MKWEKKEKEKKQWRGAKWSRHKTQSHNDTAMSAMQILNTRGVYHGVYLRLRLLLRHPPPPLLRSDSDKVELLTENGAFKDGAFKDGAKQKTAQPNWCARGLRFGGVKV